MDLNWLWHGLLTRWISGLLTICGGILLGFLKKQAPEWAGPVLYGLAGSTLIALALFAIGAMPALQQAETVTPENVEGNVRQWLYKHQFFVNNAPDERHYFKLRVSIPGRADRGEFEVNRPKEDGGPAISLIAALIEDAESKSALDKLSAAQWAVLIARLRIELARQNAALLDIFQPFTAAILIKVPITKALNEEVFFEKYRQLDSLAVLLQETFRSYMLEQKVIRR
jgi:hypothetical protein